MMSKRGKIITIIKNFKNQYEKMVDLHQPNLTSKDTNIAKRMRNYARR